MLEHTDAPEQAIMELARVLRANGLLVLTTPNRVWQGAVRAASRLRLRPFRGLENFVAWRRLERWCAAADLEVLSPSRLSSLAVSSRPERCGEDGREALRSRTSGEVDGQSGGRRAKALIGGRPLDITAGSPPASRPATLRCLALYRPTAMPQGAFPTGIVATTFWLAVSITETLSDTPLAT